MDCAKVCTTLELEVSKMITKNTRKQLRDYKRQSKGLKYLINYLIGVIDDEDNLERDESAFIQRG